ncbi:MAG: Tic20 family protein [Cyanobacteria bacterium P01_H01_bin.121]
MTWRGSTTPADRILACLPYLLPLVEVIVVAARPGSILTEIPIFAVILTPIFPLVSFYLGLGFFRIAIFFALFLLVVRNPNVSHFIRFNTMQAILIDITIFLASMIIDVILAPFGSFITLTLVSTVFLAVFAAVVYSVIQSALGRYAEIPTFSEAVHMQVR